MIVGFVQEIKHQIRKVQWALMLILCMQSMSLMAQNDTNKIAPTPDEEGLNVDLGISRNRNKYLWPLIYREKTEYTYDLQLAFTLYRNTSNLNGTYSHQHLLPLFWRTKTRGLTSFKLATLYYPSLINYTFDSSRSYKSFKLGSILPSVDLLNITKDDGNLLVENNLFFFIYFKSDKKSQRSRFVVFPLYWQYQQGLGSFETSYGDLKKSITILPLLRRVKERIRRDYGSKGTDFNYMSLSQSWVFYPLLTKIYHSNSVNTTRNSEYGKLYKETVMSKKQESLFRTFLLYKYYHFVDSQKIGAGSFAASEIEIKGSLFEVIRWKKHEESLYKRNSFTIFPIWFQQYFFYKGYVKSGLVIFPIYWQKMRKDTTGVEKSNFLFPLIYSYKRTKGDTTLYLFPLYFSQKSQHASMSTLFPIYFASSEREYYLGKEYREVKGSLAYLYWFRKGDVNGKRVETGHFFPPLFWYTARNIVGRQDTLLILTPLLGMYSNANLKVHNTWLFPLYYSDSRPSHRNTWLLPVYFYHENLDFKYRCFFPLVWTREGKHGNDKRIFLFPMYYKSKNEIRQEYALFPLFFASNTNNPAYSNEKRRSLLFWYWYYKLESKPAAANKCKINGILRHSLVPIYYYQAVENGDTSLMSMLVYYLTKSQGSQTRYIFPLYSEVRTKNTFNSSLFPLYWYDRTAFDTSLLVLPFYFRETGKNGTKRVVFPLYWSFKDSFEHFNMFLPLYLNRIRAHDTVKMITPFYWSRNTQFKNGYYSKESYSGLLFYTKHERNEEFEVKHQHAIPLLYTYNWSNIDTNKWYEQGYSGYHEPRKLGVLGLIQYREEKQIAHGFIESNSLIIYGKPHRKLYVKTKKRFTIYPLVFYKKEIVDNFRDSYDLKGRVYHELLYPAAENERTFTLFPIYFTQSRKNYSKTYVTRRRVLFPLFWYYNKPKAKSVFLLPLFGNYKNNYTDNYRYDYTTCLSFITPLYWNIHRNSGSHRLLFPLFSYKTTNLNQKIRARSGFSNFGPLEKDSLAYKAHLLYILYRYEYEKGVTSHHVLYPLINRYKDSHEKVSKFRIAPLVWTMSSPNLSYQYVIPFYGLRYKDSLTVFNLLLNTYRYKAIEGRMHSHKFLFGLVQYDRYKNGDFETRYLYKFYSNVKLDSLRERSIFPVFYYLKHKNGNYRKSILAGIYSKTKTKMAKRNEYYLEEKLFWFIRYRSNAGYLQSKGITLKEINQLTRF